MANPVGSKTFYNLPAGQFLNEWFVRARSNDTLALPLKNAVSPATTTTDVRGTRWSDGAIGSMFSNANDLQHTGNGTALLSSGYCTAGAFFVNAENLEKAAIMFAVRRLIKPTWLNNRDQFLQPSVELPQDFKDDCLIWMLFNGSNLTASADGLEWNGRKWSIVNHFIPFTEEDVDAYDGFESDFMVRYLLDRNLSNEARAVLAAGRAIWCTYFRRYASFDYGIREKLKLNRADVGWYQVRNALKLYGESAEGHPTDFTVFEDAYKTLGDKLRPQVYAYGFLKV